MCQGTMGRLLNPADSSQARKVASLLAEPLIIDTLTRSINVLTWVVTTSTTVAVVLTTVGLLFGG